MSNYHVDLTKWQSMDLFNQLGNIGSEVGRALKAKKIGDITSSDAAFYRGLELFDATLDAPSVSSMARKKEITRAREQFVEAITTPKQDPTLEAYFMHFAIAARMRLFK